MLCYQDKLGLWGKGSAHRSGTGPQSSSTEKPPGARIAAGRDAKRGPGPLPALRTTDDLDDPLPGPWTRAHLHGSVASTLHLRSSCRATRRLAKPLKMSPQGKETGATSGPSPPLAGAGRGGQRRRPPRHPGSRGRGEGSGQGRRAAGPPPRASQRAPQGQSPRPARQAAERRVRPGRALRARTEAAAGRTPSPQPRGQASMSPRPSLPAVPRGRRLPAEARRPSDPRPHEPPGSRPSAGRPTLTCAAATAATALCAPAARDRKTEALAGRASHAAGHHGNREAPPAPSRAEAAAPRTSRNAGPCCFPAGAGEAAFRRAGEEGEPRRGGGR